MRTPSSIPPACVRSPFFFLSINCQIYNRDLVLKPVQAGAADCGSGPDRGWLCTIMTPYAAGFQGNSREIWSNNQKPATRNDPILAAAANLLASGTNPPADFTCKLLNVWRAVDCLMLGGIQVGNFYEPPQTGLVPLDCIPNDGEYSPSRPFERRQSKHIAQMAEGWYPSCVVYHVFVDVACVYRDVIT